MKTSIACAAILAFVLVFALFRKGDVRANLKMFGVFNFSLETKD